MLVIVIILLKYYIELEFLLLLKLELFEYICFKFENGIVVYLMEDYEFFLIGGCVLFCIGLRFELEN